MELLRIKLKWWIRLIIHLSKPTECAAPTVNPSANYGLRVSVTCQCRFLGWNKCAILVGDVENEGSFAYVEAGGYMGKPLLQLPIAENLKLL